MFQSKDGRKFGSAFVAKRRDAEHAKMSGMETPAHEAKESPDFEAGEKEGMKEAQSGSEGQGESVVAEHGKATTVHIKHDHKSGKHHVTSMHPDGHVHESDHLSASEAHDEASKLGGAEEVPEEETPSATDTEETPEADGFKMPRLA